MTEITSDTYPFYYVAYDQDPNASVVHFGKAEEGNEVNTGQPLFQVYTDEDEWIERINELKGVENWYESNGF